jgi:hypothetical protein
MSSFCIRSDDTACAFPLLCSCCSGFFDRLKQRILRLFGRENRYTNNGLVDALKKMDEPRDWDRLMVIGHMLAEAKRAAIEDWVQTWVVGGPVLTADAK